MKTTLLIVITAVFALGADEAKPKTDPHKLTDTQKLRLSKIEADFLAQKSAALEAEVMSTRANSAMQQLQARHAAESKGIVAELKADVKCTVTKAPPEGPDGKPIEGAPVDWVLKCPTAAPPPAPVTAKKAGEAK